MLYRYKARSLDDIYLEDIPLILHPHIAQRWLADTALPGRRIKEWDLPQGYSQFVSQYHSFHFQQPHAAYRDVLSDVTAGRVVLLKPHVTDSTQAGVSTSSGDLLSDLPLFLHRHLRNLITHQRKRPVHYLRRPTPAQQSQTINSKAAGRLLAAGGIYNGNVEGFRKTAEQLGGDAPTGYAQVIDNQGLLIAGASIAAGLGLGRSGAINEISHLSKIPFLESPRLRGFCSEKGTLLNAGHAIIDPKKLAAYALDSAHPTGGHKARVFESALGYNPTNADILAARVQEGILFAPAKQLDANNFGQPMAVDIPILGINGKTAIVRTGWMYETDAVVPRLTTLFVKGE